MHPKATKELSYSQLAKALEITRATLTVWRGMKGAPAGTNLDEWKKWAEANRHRLAGSKELRDEKTRHEIELLKAKLDREHRRVIPRDEVNRVLLHAATQSRTKLYQFLETEAPPKLDGLPASQMRPILREMADSVCDTMANIFEDFEKAP